MLARGFIRVALSGVLIASGSARCGAAVHMMRYNDAVPEEVAKRASETRRIAPDAMHHWDSADGTQRFTAQGVVIKIERQHRGQYSFPVLTARAANGQPISIRGSDGADGYVSADFAIGRIDGAHRGGDVLFSSASIGFHCCFRLKVLSLTRSGWKVVDLGSLDEGKLDGEKLSFPRDVAQGGHSPPVFVIGDQRFLYALDGYVADHLPPRVFGIRNGRVEELTQMGKYRHLFDEDARDALKLCLQRVNGARAAFVADAARLGRFRDAWRTMSANYDPNSHWPPPGLCRHVKYCDHVPKSFPEALAAFLLATGYVRQNDLEMRE